MHLSICEYVIYKKSSKYFYLEFLLELLYSSSFLYNVSLKCLRVCGFYKSLPEKSRVFFYNSFKLILNVFQNICPL